MSPSPAATSISGPRVKLWQRECVDVYCQLRILPVIVRSMAGMRLQCVVINRLYF